MSSLIHPFERAALAAAFPGAAFDVRLSELTSFRIGGPADAIVVAESAGDVLRALQAAADLAIPITVLGGGTNVLVSDKGVRGVVLVNRSSRIARDGDALVVEAGTLVDDVVRFAAECSLWGLSFAAGLPGTIGGALSGNAGCYGRTIGDLIESATVATFDGRSVAARERAWFGFAYRKSRLSSERHVVLDAMLALKPGDRLEIEEEMKRGYEARRGKHPSDDMPSAGSYFRNLSPADGVRRKSTGELLDKLGVRGLRVGGAMVFEHHANIIVNVGGATAADVLALAARLKRMALEAEGVVLEEEVRFVGEL